ncbi:hypothetical protein LEMLEM_LOCUS6212, partial [Lemmus lemmus]
CGILPVHLRGLAPGNPNSLDLSTASGISFRSRLLRRQKGSAMAILGCQLDSPEMEGAPVRDFLLVLKWGNTDL